MKATWYKYAASEPTIGGNSAPFPLRETMTSSLFNNIDPCLNLLFHFSPKTYDPCWFLLLNRWRNFFKSIKYKSWGCELPQFFFQTYLKFHYAVSGEGRAPFQGQPLWQQHWSHHLCLFWDDILSIISPLVSLISHLWVFFPLCSSISLFKKFQINFHSHLSIEILFPKVKNDLVAGKP